MRRNLSETTAGQVADELYGLHCDIGRLERQNNINESLIKSLQSKCLELYRMSDPSKCCLCEYPCMEDQPPVCALEESLRDLGVEI